jgi:hypothetical protein
MKLQNSLYAIFAFITCLFYGVIFSGQVLGLLRIYSAIPAVVLSILVGGCLFFLFMRNREWIADFPEAQPVVSGWGRALELALLGTGIVLFVVLALYPLADWPFSSISHPLTWDAGLYHFPKAIEMLAHGSAWDMSIDYGEYPFGYESMLALAFGLNHAGYLIGLAHALIAAYFFLAVWLLVARFTRLPRRLITLLVVVLLLSRLFFPKLDSNIWWIIWTQVILIGKNDLLLGGALLSIVLFMPFGETKGRFFLPGLAAASMIALSVKPNAALLVVFAWVAVLIELLRAGQIKPQPRRLAAAGALILPGLLWAARNLVALHALFSPAALKLGGLSIAANLTNPYLYKHIPSQLVIVVALLGLVVGAAFHWKRLRWHALTGAVFLLTFVLTPASAFLGSNQQPAQIAWRFALALLGYEFVLLLVLFEPVILRVYDWLAGKPWLCGAGIALTVCFGVWGLYMGRDLLRPEPHGERVLQDQFPAAVGVDGYYSAYDFVQKNVHGSVVIVENGLPYYLYDAGFTDSVTRSRPADTLVVFKTAWTPGKPEAYPELISQPGWDAKWKLVYEDSQGRVYKRKP